MENITITQLNRSSMSGQYGQYNRVFVVDEKGRKISALGKWADNWKVGDVISVIIETSNGVDKQTGNPIVYLNAKNPNPKPAPNFSKSSKSSPESTLVTSYKLASALLPVFFSKIKASPTLKDLDDLATQIKSRISPIQDQQKVSTPVVPEINLDEAPIANTQNVENTNVANANVVNTNLVKEEEEDERPF